MQWIHDKTVHALWMGVLGAGIVLGSITPTANTVVKLPPHYNDIPGCYILAPQNHRTMTLTLEHVIDTIVVYVPSVHSRACTVGFRNTIQETESPRYILLNGGFIIGYGVDRIDILKDRKETEIFIWQGLKVPQSALSGVQQQPTVSQQASARQVHADSLSTSRSRSRRRSLSVVLALAALCLLIWSALRRKATY